MFRKPTVFIIGAGASAEFGMPTGAALKDLMAKSLRMRFEFGHKLTSGDPGLFEVLRRKYPNEINTHLGAASTLAASLPAFVSIDEALHFHSDTPEIVTLGKLEIVRQILKAERASSIGLKQDTGRPDVIAAGTTWLHHLLSMTLSMLKRDEISDAFSSLTLITFNYDRIPEHFLYWGLQQIAGANPNEAAAATSKLKIIRPYGSVGELDWQKGNSGTGFGGGSSDLFQLAEDVKTYTEQHHTTLKESICSHLDDAELIVILGFGYHDQNLSLLSPGKQLQHHQRIIFGTVKGIDKDNHDLIRARLQSDLSPTGINLSDRSAAQALSDLRPSIMAAAH